MKLIKYQTIENLADEIGEAKELFYSSALLTLVAFKVHIGRCIRNAPQIEKKYGGSFIPKLSAETGLSESILKDAAEMYKTEKLSPLREKRFIQSFVGEYSSWNDYLTKRLDRKKAIGAGESEKCKHCPIHCK